MKAAALAIVLTPTATGDQILLVRRKDIPVWVLPGGGIEAGESPEQAAVRETREESGLVVAVQDHVATYTPINRLASTTHLFLCVPVGPAGPLFTDPETESAKFFDTQYLPPSLFPLHKTFITEWSQAPTLPIIRDLSEVSYRAAAGLLLAHPCLSVRYLYTRFMRAT